MNKASLITNVFSHVVVTDNQPEKITRQFSWTGTDYKRGLKKSDDTFSLDHESIYFSSVPVNVSGHIEIAFLSGDLHAAGCTCISVNTGFIFTYFKGVENIVKEALYNSLS